MHIDTFILHLFLGEIVIFREFGDWARPFGGKIQVQKAYPLLSSNMAVENTLGMGIQTGKSPISMVHLCPFSSTPCLIAGGYDKLIDPLVLCAGN